MLRTLAYEMGEEGVGDGEGGRNEDDTGERLHGAGGAHSVRVVEDMQAEGMILVESS